MTSSRVTQPFIGLRSFTREDDALFYGRDRLINGLLTRLSETRFVTVLGRSGAGKSSLVKAGLIPALEAGYLDWNGANWEIVTIQPGGNPINSLAAGLAASDWGKAYTRGAGPNEATRTIAQRLRADSMGLTHAVGAYPPADNARLLLIVDQFEETFRFGVERDAVSKRGASEVERSVSDIRDAKHFVDTLVDAVSSQAPIYIILTMRSDFLGLCGEHPGLADAVNRGVFLVSDMTESEMVAAIEMPARFAGGKVEPALVSALLNEVNGAQYQLPMLQHVLMRLWESVPDGAPRVLTVPMLRALGDSSAVLGEHLSQIFNLLDPPEREVAEKLFKCITKMVDDKNVRDPASLRTIVEETGASKETLISVIEKFRAPKCSFISPLPPEKLVDDSYIDITHEAVIHGWKLLKKWMVEESQSARHYMELCKGADRERYDGLLRDSADLQEKARWRDRVQPTAAWARRYGGDFNEAMRFFERSLDARDRSMLREAIQAGKFNTSDPESITRLIDRGVRLTQRDLQNWEYAPHYLVLVPDQIARLYGPQSSDETSLESSNTPVMTSEDFARHIPPEAKRVKTLGGLSLAHFGAAGGNKEMLDYLRGIGVNFEETTERGTKAFVFGCDRDDTSALDWFAEKFPGVDFVNHQNERGWTALMYAVGDGRLKAVEWLLGKGADVNKADREGATALHVASNQLGRADAIPLLLRRGADPNRVTELGRSPIYDAAVARNSEALARLLEASNANANLPDKDGATPIIAALQSWGIGPIVPVLRMLVEKGAEVRAVYPRTGDTPLSLALENLARWEGLGRVVDLLVQKRAYVDVPNAEGKTPIGIALTRNHEDIAIDLLHTGERQGGGDRSAEWLANAAATNSIEFLYHLLKSGVSVDVMHESSDGLRSTALHVAAGAGAAGAVQLLLDHGAKQDALDSDGETPLRVALRRSEWRAAKTLIDAGSHLPKWLTFDIDREGQQLKPESRESIRASLCKQLKPATDVEWPFEPIIKGNWRLLAVEEAAAALDKLYQDTLFLLREVSERIDAVREVNVPFIEGGKLIEARVSADGAVQGYYTFLRYADTTSEVDGQKASLEFAPSVLRLGTRESAALYLRFACAASEYDRYFLSLIESAEDAFREGGLSVSDEARARVAGAATAVTFDTTEPQSGPVRWTGHAVVQYGSSLWPVAFKLNANGSVDLRGEGTLGEDLPCPEIRFFNGVRTVSVQRGGAASPED